MKEMKGFEEFVFENSKSTLIEEGLMAQIDTLIQDTKDVEEFVKKFFKEYGSKIKKDKKSEEWVRSLYSGSTNEAIVEAEDVTLKYADFLNEGTLNEAMDVSDDLKKVKTLEDFLSVTKGKYIVIQSKHDILNIRKRGGQWPAIWIAWDTSKKVVPHLTITDRASALSVNYIANESSGRYGVSPERLFEFFMFNKKRGNKIYTESKMPMQNEIKPLYDKIVGGMSEISNKILTYEVDLGNRKIGNGHVLRKEGQSHGDRIYEYTVNKMGKTAIYNVYYNTTKISEGRNTFRTGYGDNDVFKVGAKDQRRIGDIFETNSNLMDKCLGIINKWIKGQAIKVK
jgi:hypothetical protein